jgi:hypothetical protein
MRGGDARENATQEETMPTRAKFMLTAVMLFGFPLSRVSTLGVPTAHFESLAGLINALLDGMRMLFDFVSVALGLVTLLIALFAMEDGDWLPLLALVIGLGVPVAAIILAPLVPYGNILSVCLILLSPTVAYWIVVSHCPPG